MQLKLAVQEPISPTAKNSAVRYNTFALCNKCGSTHDMAVSFILNDGQSIQKDKHQIFLVPAKTDHRSLLAKFKD